VSLGFASQVLAASSGQASAEPIACAAEQFGFSPLRRACDECARRGIGNPALPQPAFDGVGAESRLSLAPPADQFDRQLREERIHVGAHAARACSAFAAGPAAVRLSRGEGQQLRGSDNA
jgi:hypothetical protein